MMKNTIMGLEIMEVVELLNISEEFNNPFEWTLIDETHEEIYQELSDKHVCHHCGKTYSNLVQENYSSNINGESGSECMDLLCPNCKGIVEVLDIVYY